MSCDGDDLRDQIADHWHDVAATSPAAYHLRIQLAKSLLHRSPVDPVAVERALDGLDIASLADMESLR